MQNPWLVRCGKNALFIFAWLVALGCTVWAVGALYYDAGPWKGLAVSAFVCAAASAVIGLRGCITQFGALFLLFALVLGWWLTLQPRQDRRWLADADRTAWAEVKDDAVTLHEVRNC